MNRGKESKSNYYFMCSKKIIVSALFDPKSLQSFQIWLEEHI